MLFWKFAYYCVYMIHYVGTFVAILFVVSQTLTPSTALIRIVYFLVAWLFIVLLANGICGGCPFSYLEQYCEIKAGWRKKITYTLKDSWAYIYIFSRFKK